MRKKTITLMLTILLLCLILVVSLYVLLIISHKEVGDLVFTELGISVYQADNSYLMLIEKRGKVTGTLEFSSEKNLIKCKGITPLEIMDIRILLGQPLEKVELAYGNYHVNTGSGFFIPSYVTMEGILVKMWIEDGVVAHVSKIDLFSGMCMEWYTLDSISSR